MDTTRTTTIPDSAVVENPSIIHATAQPSSAPDPAATLPIWEAMLSGIAGAVDIAYDLHNRTNGATVTLKSGDMAGKKLFAVSIYPAHTIELWERPTWQEIFDFAQARVDLLLKPGHALGIWFDDYNQVHMLDVVLLVADLDTALALALQNNQIAIFDLGSRREIEVSRPTGKLVAIRAGGVNA